MIPEHEQEQQRMFAMSSQPNVDVREMHAAMAASGVDVEAFLDGAQAILKKAEEIFADPIYRSIAVRILTLILGFFGR